jgi:hypothetical protein
MTIPINPQDLNSVTLREAIRQLKQELPDILGPNYLSFVKELDALLQEGSNEELLTLFVPYPNAYNRLQDILSHFSAGHGLYGDSISKPAVLYYCQAGRHYVDEMDVQKKDVAGRPLCPDHGKPLTLAP